MSLTGFWTGEYSYDEAPTERVEFQAEIKQLRAIIMGSITELNTFDPVAGQMLIGQFAGSVSHSVVSFIKHYVNSEASNSHRIKYQGQLSDDRSEIIGRWIVGDDFTGPFKMVRAVEQKPME